MEPEKGLLEEEEYRPKPPTFSSGRAFPFAATLLFKLLQPCFFISLDLCRLGTVRDCFGTTNRILETQSSLSLVVNYT